MNTIEVDVNNLVRGQNYIVTRRNAAGVESTFHGKFDNSNPHGNIVFIENGARRSFPIGWVISVHVPVSPLLPGDLNKEISKFTAGKSRRKRKRKSTRRR